MKCKVCGAESGKYILCYSCNIKRQEGIIIKCEKSKKWHYADQKCENENNSKENNFLYQTKKSLITETEKEYYIAIKSALTADYQVFPQINLAAFIERTDRTRFRNELFRNVDFLITDLNYKPKIVIEINDKTHLESERKERDEKVKNICEEAGIPIIKLWTSYGVNYEYIKNKIQNTLSLLPIERIHHFNQNNIDIEQKTEQPEKKSEGACYIATCVYGSYNSPEVMILRKYRDNKLSKSIKGRIFVKIYYKISPILVKYFGTNKWFKKFWKKFLDKLINKLKKAYNEPGQQHLLF